MTSSAQPKPTIEPNPNASEIARLLQDGLDAYGIGQSQKAIESWKRVLELDPENEQAIDFLSSSGIKVSKPVRSDKVVSIDRGKTKKSSPKIDVKMLKQQVASLLQAGQYQAALDLLEKLNRKQPDQPQIREALQTLEAQVAARLTNTSKHSKDIAAEGEANPNPANTSLKEKDKVSNVNETLQKALEIDGALGVALVDYNSGMNLGSLDNNSGLDLDLAAAGNTEVVSAKKKVRDDLGIKSRIEDILITLESQYHLIRMVKGSVDMFLYLVLDRNKSNLAMARKKLELLDNDLKI